MGIQNILVISMGTQEVISIRFKSPFFPRMFAVSVCRGRRGRRGPSVIRYPLATLST